MAKDMIGQELSSGDYFIIPGGNARYGGLILEVGIIVFLPEHGKKMLKVITTRWDKIKPLPKNKTPQKVLKIDLTQDMKQNEAMIKLKEQYDLF
jgi:hypothetical protein